MYPKGRFEIDFDKRDEGNDQKPDDDEGEKCRAIRRIMVFEDKVAMATRIHNTQNILEQFSVAALGAARGE